MSELTSSPTSDTKLTKAFSRTPSSWDPQDDLLLRHLKEQQKLGWKEIASHFAHRTPNACQFRWRRLRSGSLKTNTNSPTPTSGANTPSSTTTSSNTHNNNNNSNNGASSTGSHLGNDSSSNSASPQLSSSTKDASLAVPLVSKFSSIPSNKSNSSSTSISILQSSSPKKEKKTIGMSAYNQWSFQNSTSISSKQSKTHKSKNDVVEEDDDDDDGYDDDDDLDIVSLKKQPRGSMAMDPLSTSRPPIQDMDSDDDKNSSVFIDQQDWTMDEDELLISRRKRALSFAELSILLPLRTEGEIMSRIGELERKSIPSISSSSIITTSNTTPITITPTQKIKRSSSTTTRHHSHPNPIHSSSSHSTSFPRSYSSSSQTSIAGTSSSPGGSQFLLNQDSLRSKSFSYIAPYAQSTDRYSNLRKNSITNSINEAHHYNSRSSRSRSNSFLQNPRTRSNSFLNATPFHSTLLTTPQLSNDREPIKSSVEQTLKREATSSSDNDDEQQLKIEPKLPPLGSIFNDLYSR